MFLLGLAALRCLLASWPLDYLLTVLGESSSAQQSSGETSVGLPSSLFLSRNASLLTGSSGTRFRLRPPHQSSRLSRELTSLPFHLQSLSFLQRCLRKHPETLLWSHCSGGGSDFPPSSLSDLAAAKPGSGVVHMTPFSYCKIANDDAKPLPTTAQMLGS